MTRVDLETCGGCHPDQYASFATLNLKKPARTEKSLLTERAPNPFWDKLMMGHGFTKEHANPRSHAFMLVDHLIVDRAYGGRFQAKDGWGYVSMPGPVNAWDVLVDRYPDSKEHKAFLPESAAAANPTCLQCKTQDKVLQWKYMGDKDERAKWNRGSNVVEFVKELNTAMNCFMCHDPHAAKPRIVRDGLIQALTRPEKDTLWHKDAKATKIDVKEFRGGFRKIALLEKYDAKLQCGQCHVEYNCNPGFDPTTGEYSIKAPDQRTNHFPFKDVLQIYDHYNTLGFRDFKHSLTGGLLWKAQHPEAETFWNSVHDKAGASCDTCHMPKVSQREGDGVHLPLADEPAELPEADVPDVEVPPEPYGGAGELRDRLRPELHQGEDAQGGVLALGPDRQDRRGEEGGAPARGDQGGAGAAPEGARSLGVVDGRELRRIPQPGPGPRVVDEVGRGVAQGDQADRRRPREEDGVEVTG